MIYRSSIRLPASAVAITLLCMSTGWGNGPLAATAGMADGSSQIAGVELAIDVAPICRTSSKVRPAISGLLVRLYGGYLIVTGSDQEPCGGSRRLDRVPQWQRPGHDERSVRWELCVCRNLQLSLTARCVPMRRGRTVL